MEKIAAMLLFPLIIIGFLLLFISQQSQKPFSPSSQAPTVTITEPEKKPIDSLGQSVLFVPYWTVGSKKIADEKYDAVVYFGVAATAQGIDTEDLGYKNVGKIGNLLSPGKKKYLAIRMIDTKEDSKILDDLRIQKKIAEDAAILVKKYRFDGVVFDFEITALGFDSVIKGITSFYKDVGRVMQREQIPYFVTLYGDSFYRTRPYEIKSIGKLVDGILIMTYDFHKARGNPGPNFPLSGKAIYGYDLPQMLGDFSSQVSKEKITVILGYYGYDWVVDAEGNAIEDGVPVSFSEVQKKYYPVCGLKECKIKRDSLSGETVITYEDHAKKKHVLWFEDNYSINKKRDYVESQGIKSIGYWAYSYF